VQELLGHVSVETTMIYTRVLNTGRCPVRSPLDQPPPVLHGSQPPTITGAQGSATKPQAPVPKPLAANQPGRDDI
jgi:hypothetical protein